MPAITYAEWKAQTPPSMRAFTHNAWASVYEYEEWSRIYFEHYDKKIPWPDVTEKVQTLALRLHEEWCWEDWQWEQARAEEKAKQAKMFQAYGMDKARRLDADAADFYLLEWLNHTAYPGAKAMLKQHTETVAAQLESYLFYALGGEARHGARASEEWGVGVPMAIHEWVSESWTLERYEAWEAWHTYTAEMSRIERMDKIAAIRDLMFDDSWGGEDGSTSVGGAMWGLCARVLLDRMNGTLNAHLFLDRCFTLEHNNGCVFDKVWDTRQMPTVLELQAHSKYNTLSQYASDQVRTLWREYRDQSRQEFDPAWLGVQAV